MVALALPLKVALSVVLLRGAIIGSARAFSRKVVRRVILSVGTQISMKVPKCGKDFPIRLIERSILHRKERE